MCSSDLFPSHDRRRNQSRELTNQKNQRKLEALTYLVAVTALASNAALIVNSEPYRTLLTKFTLDFKPFNCVQCFAFWTTIIFGFPVTIQRMICLLAGFSGFLATEIDKRLNTF